MRINIPSNPDLLIQLASTILAKHTALGAASPLAGIDGIASFGTQVTAADTHNKNAKDFAQKSEQATETRDNALGYDTTTPGSVRYVVTAARDVLAAVNKGNEHKLGDWGFVVDATPASAAKAVPAAKAKATA